jgi:predicted nucleic acid-binding protein
MTGPFFVDTNVLVYADDADAGAKRDAARELLRKVLPSGQAVFSLQVLQEYYAVATRRLQLPPEAARSRVEALSRLEVVAPRIEDLLAAIDLHRLHSLSIWDATIVRSALVSGCRVLYTEDLQHGRRFDGVEVVNPFDPRSARVE